MGDIYPTPCIHSPDGRTLCPACQADYDEDPLAWESYGAHPAGIANAEALEREIAEHFTAEGPPPPVPEDLPY